MITLGPDVQILANQAVMVFAQNQSPGTPGYNDGPMGPEFGKASPIGIPVVLLLLVATVLLIRNMNKHIKGLPESFDMDNPGPDQLADEGTDRAGVPEGSEGSEGAETEAEAETQTATDTDSENTQAKAGGIDPEANREPDTR